MATDDSKAPNKNVLPFPTKDTDEVPLLIYSSRNAQGFWRVFIVDVVNDLMVPITKGKHKTDDAAKEEARVFMEKYLALPPGSPLIGYGPAVPMYSLNVNFSEDGSVRAACVDVSSQ